MIFGGALRVCGKPQDFLQRKTEILLGIGKRIEFDIDEKCAQNPTAFLIR